MFFSGHRNISLGGASRKEMNKDSLLALAEDLRQKRKEDRIRSQAASYIQNWFRNIITKRNIRNNLRHSYSTNRSSLDNSLSALLLFYNHRLDSDKLSVLSSKFSPSLFKDCPDPKRRLFLFIRLIKLFFKNLSIQYSEYPVFLLVKDLLLNLSDRSSFLNTDLIISNPHFQLVLLNAFLNSDAFQKMANLIKSNDSNPNPIDSFPSKWALECSALLLNLCCDLGGNTSMMALQQFSSFSLSTISNLQTISAKDLSIPFPLVFEGFANGLISLPNSESEKVSLLCASIKIFTSCAPDNNSPDLYNNYLAFIAKLLVSVSTSFFSQFGTLNAGSNTSDDDDEEMPAISLPEIPLKTEQKELILSLSSRHFIQTCCKVILPHLELFSLVNFCITLFGCIPSSKIDILNALLQYAHVNLIQKLVDTLLLAGGLLEMATKSPFPTMLAKQEAHVESWVHLTLFCELYSRMLMTLGDDEFFSNQKLLDETMFICTALKNIVFNFIWQPELISHSNFFIGTNINISESVTLFSRLLCQIYDRDTRKRFTNSDSFWILSDCDISNYLEMLPYQELADIPKSGKIYSCQLIMRSIPFVISFEKRIQLFRNYIKHDSMQQGNTDLDFALRRGAKVTIRRGSIFEDGYTYLNGLGSRLKQRVQITFVDQFGIEEAGIDGGGVFKEFMTSCLAEAFSPHLGLFETTKERLLYPAATEYASQDEQLHYFEFLGRIIGKAMYEGVLIDSSFAVFFLRKWLGTMSFLDDLPSLDQELYNGLVFVKNYNGDYSDLGLNFTVTEENFGQVKHVELIPNGSNISVTKANCIRYIYLVANYKLNVRIAKQCAALFRGLIDLISPQWLKMFNHNELQVLLGGNDVPISAQELKRYTTYGGVYDVEHPTIIHFWNVVEAFTPEERQKLVKFITSCSKPPLLGFGELHPPLCIRFGGQEQDRLPTASTCVNLLKLPAYESAELLKEKLLLAINAEAGFDMS